jgi:PKD repeat protein
MNKKFNSFDAQIKESYEAFEPSYDASSWDALGEKLDGMAPSPLNYFLIVASGIAAAGLIFMTLVFSMDDNSSTEKMLVNQIEAMEGKESPQNDKPIGDTLAVQQSTADSAETIDLENENARLPQEESNDRNRAEGTLPEIISSNAGKDRADGKQNRSGHEPTFGSAASSADAGQTESAAMAAETPKLSLKEKVIATDKVITSIGSTHKKDVHVSCAGITIQFEASQEYGNEAKYLWNFGDGFFSNEANPSHTFAKPGTFDVSLSVTSYATGQISSNVVQAMIEVLDAPKAKATIHPISIEEIEFRNSSLGGSEIEWRKNDDLLAGEEQAQISFVDNTRTQLELVVLNESGCIDTLRHEISFAHNGQKHELDAAEKTPFFPPLPNASSTLEAIHIFDASTGKKVDFASGDEGWDYSQAKRNREYYYVAVAKNNGQIEMHRGSVNVK